jgi:hypothetical protein
MGLMRDFLITIHNGGDEAVAAVQRMGDDWRLQLEQAAAEVERLWIPVDERLPELHEHVIGWQQGWARAAEVWLGANGQWLGGDFEPADEVSHWMPLPAPPTDAK